MENGEMTIEKIYFTIGETAAMFNVNASLLRYWEKEFNQIKPYKNKKGDRYFTKDDLEIIRTIYYLTKEKGYTLQGAKEALKQQGNRVTETAQIVETLQKVKALLLEVKNEL